MDTFLAKIMGGFNALPGSRKMTLAIVAVMVALSIGTFVWFMNQADYRVLFSNLSSGDAANILTKLKEKKVPYQISTGGDVISVPAGQVSELRLELAAEGIPQGGGVGFEIFDNKSFGTTDFEKQINYRRALQGELARTINSLDEIQQSRVHIALPKDSLFIDQQKKTTASVTIRLKQGKKLKPSQIEGIGHLVASSVEGLRAADVMIVDSQGDILSKIIEGDSRLTQMSASQVEYKKNIEKDMAGQIQTLLENVVGPGKAAVRVSAELDFRVMEKTEELYDPESPVIRSTQKQLDKMTGPAPVPGKTAALSPSAGPEKEKSEEIVNYEINKVVSKTVMPVGDVKKLSVAVVVDGIYSKDSKGALVYQERPKKDVRIPGRSGPKIGGVERPARRSANCEQHALQPRRCRAGDDVAALAGPAGALFPDHQVCRDSDCPCADPPVCDQAPGAESCSHIPKPPPKNTNRSTNCRKKRRDDGIERSADAAGDRQS